MKKKVIIDVATIYPGQGGAGGGIWSYAKNLLLQLDQRTNDTDMEFICLVNSQFSLPLKNLRKKELPYNFQNFIIRFFYTHFYLPFYVFTKKGILHKLYFESPIFLSSSMVVTIHDCMSNYYQEKNYIGPSIGQKLKFIYFNFINRRAVKQSSFICTPSKFVKDEILRYYSVSPDKIIVTPLATEINKELLQGKKKCRKIKLYCIAAFHKHKGYWRLVEIFEKMVTAYRTDADLYLRGHVNDEQYFNQLISKIESSAAKNNIHIVEYRRQSSLQDIYFDADWVILLSEYEGFGLPVIEAQANRVPVICSNIPTFTEVAGDTVFYINENEDALASAEKLHALLNDEHRRNEMIEKGLKNAARYDWKRFTKQIIDIYKMASV